ncbi:putative baseplate assembly protein [Actinoplanes sp. NPDC026623]|uniref:putative baseplate assembly protein n=1 Tax=Actinoplanes sp. NPDC026623 TaxID=3155610 RepID=UPI0033E41931
MPLPVPALDSRTWPELITEVRALLPRLAPGWTDHNAHDPGITLLELFSWLTEMQLFQLDRLPPATLRSFLRLVGVEPRPAGIATTTVAIRQAPAAAAVILPPGFQVSDAGRTTIFESPSALTVSPAWLEIGDEEGTTRGRIEVAEGDRRTDVTADNGSNARVIRPFGPRPQPGNALRLGFAELPAEPGARLSLYAWTATWAGDEHRAAALRLENERLAGRCGRQADDAWTRHYRARLVWEYQSAGGWQPMRVVTDETRALTLTGRVVLVAPSVHRRDPADGRFWIRCRLASGGYECPPRLRMLALNAVPVRHAATVPGPEQLGSSRGTAAQSFRLASGPVVAGSSRIRVVTDGVGDDWQEVAEWDRTGPDDRHYRLDPRQATAHFGNGRQGRVPPAGARVEARGYRIGGGTDGNVPAGRLTRLAGAGALLRVLQPFDATAGAAAETLGEAHGRALDLLASPSRGITSADLEALAGETPGVPVGRAHAVPGHHPAYGCLDAAGVVTVVVLPECGDPPQPSRQFLDAVRRYLEPRRPLATELLVTGPSYVPVTVTATLHVGAGAPPDMALRAEEDLAAFFHPLTGGADGEGWPFGRDVLETEVMARLNMLPGVRFVDGLGLTGPGDARPRCGNLPLCPTELVASRPHRITVKEGQR